jgi:hypothetical protein
MDAIPLHPAIRGDDVSLSLGKYLKVKVVGVLSFAVIPNN